MKNALLRIALAAMLACTARATGGNPIATNPPPADALKIAAATRFFPGTAGTLLSPSRNEPVPDWLFQDETMARLRAAIPAQKHHFFTFAKSRFPAPYAPAYGSSPAIKRRTVPVSDSYRFGNVPMDVFVEFAPILDLSAQQFNGFSAGIGARIWF